MTARPLLLAFSFFIVALGFSVYWIAYLHRAHSSFENYYAFRGCTQLLTRQPEWATCRTASGDTVKIVKYEDKWYLDGDLPWACVGKLCFGI